MTVQSRSFWPTTYMWQWYDLVYNSKLISDLTRTTSHGEPCIVYVPVLSLIAWLKAIWFARETMYCCELCEQSLKEDSVPSIYNDTASVKPTSCFLKQKQMLFTDLHYKHTLIFNNFKTREKPKPDKEPKLHSIN